MSPLAPRVLTGSGEDGSPREPALNIVRACSNQGITLLGGLLGLPGPAMATTSIERAVCLTWATSLLNSVQPGTTSTRHENYLLPGIGSLSRIR